MTKEEVEMVLNEMNPNNALGSDDFLTFFFQIFWYRIKDEVVHAVRHFFFFGMLPNSWNQTYITLIPKKENPFLPNDF